MERRSGTESFNSSRSNDELILFDEAYTEEHKIYEVERQRWEEFTPLTRNLEYLEASENLIFTAFYRYKSMFYSEPPMVALIGIHSDVLKAVLKACVEELDLETDPVPRIDARTLFIHEDEIRAQLLIMMKRVEESDLRDITLSEIRRIDALPISSSQHLNPILRYMCLEFFHLDKLVTFLNSDFARLHQAIDEFKEFDEVDFAHLWCFLHKGITVTFADSESEATMAGVITSTRYPTKVPGIEEDHFEISARSVSHNGSHFFYAIRKLKIPYFRSVKFMSSLEVKILEDNSIMMAELRSRGAEFVKLAGRHYLEYHDSVYKRHDSPSLLGKLDATGRVMVDCVSYKKMYPMEAELFIDERSRSIDPSIEDLVICSPTVFGYSFVGNVWGRFLVDKFTPVVWNSDAWKYLVLPDCTKTLIKSLVEADRTDGDIVKDVISGKGGGFIVVLHGRPGTGKTLTAEAIAEERQAPLWRVSLESSGIGFELRLAKILEISKVWGAVVLFDEADVFLQERSMNTGSSRREIRNPLAGVLLRALDRHPRMIFMTTNRIRTLDEAIRSRISLAIKYRDLHKSARRQVWENFLGLAGVKIIDGSVNGIDSSIATITRENVEELASWKFSGRNIKNRTSMALALSASTKQPFGYDLLKQVLDAGGQFQKDLDETVTEGMYAAKGEETQDFHAMYF